MSLILPGNVASATAAVGFSVANSCRFNDGDSANLTRTPGSAGSQVKWTKSVWIKRGILGTTQYIGTAVTGSNEYICQFTSADKIDWYQYNGSGFDGRILTTRVFRDCSAWYHFVFVWDTGNATAGNRMRIYVNGVEETVFDVDTNPSGGSITSSWNDDTANYIGTYTDSAGYFDGYMAEYVFINNAALTPTSFGEFNEDSPTIWQPIETVEDLTPGTNGFYLDFEASDNLGNDAFGGTDWTEDNLAAVDQSTDTPTNNFCVMNPLDNFYQQGVFSQGNTKWANAAADYTFGTGTMGMTSGKFYWECYISAISTGPQDLIGVAARIADVNNQPVGAQDDTWGYLNNDGNIWHDGDEATSYGDTWTAADIIGVYLDLDNLKLYFAKNGTVQNSGTGISITAPASTVLGAYLPAISSNEPNPAAKGAYSFNFGNGVFDGTAVSSSNADANGYGLFEYNPSAGTFDSASKNFLALCTKNLGSDGG